MAVYFAFLPVCVSLLPVLGQTGQVGRNDFIPIETRNERAISVPFLKLDPRPWVLEKGQQSITWGFSAANDIRKSYKDGVAAVYEDYENDIFMARYRQGIGNGMDFTVDTTLISRGGGFLDPIIDGYHRLIGLTNNVRTGAEYGQCIIEVPGSGPYRDAIGFGDIAAMITKALTPRLMGTVAIKLPTGNSAQILGSGNFDGAFDFQYRVPNGSRWMWQFQGGLVAQGKSTELQGTRGINPQAAIILMHKADRLNSYVFQWQSEESGIVTGVGGSDSPHRVVSAAWQHVLSNNRLIEVFISDDGDFVNTFHDPEIANIGPEPTIGVRYLVKF